MIGDVVVEGVLGVVGVHLVEEVGQMAGIGHRAVVGRPTEEECPIVGDVVLEVAQIAIAEECHLKRL